MAKLIKATIEQIKFLKKHNLANNELYNNKKLASVIIIKYKDKLKKKETLEKELEDQFKIVLNKND